MSLRTAYQEKLEAQLEEQKAKINLLKARAKRVVADGKIIGYEEVAQTGERIESMKKRLKNLPGSSVDAAREIKAGLQKAMTELKDSCKKASAKFGKAE